MTCDRVIGTGGDLRLCGRPTAVFAIQQYPDGAPIAREFCNKHKGNYWNKHYKTKEKRDLALALATLEAL